jgi:hypothetical protein
VRWEEKVALVQWWHGKYAATQPGSLTRLRPVRQMRKPHVWVPDADRLGLGTACFLDARESNSQLQLQLVIFIATHTSTTNYLFNNVLSTGDPYRAVRSELSSFELLVDQYVTSQAERLEIVNRFRKLPKVSICDGKT